MRVDRQVIDEISQLGSDYDQVRSIVLIGSASRGEQVYANNKLISDIEFVFLVSEEFTSSDRESVLSQVAKIESALGVQIDISLPTMAVLYRQKNRLFVRDMVETGNCIYGENFIECLKERLPDHPLQYDLNNIIFYRLLSIIIKSTNHQSEAEAKISNLSYVIFYVLFTAGEYEPTFDKRFKKIRSSLLNTREPLSTLTRKFFDSDVTALDLAEKFRKNGFESSYPKSIMRSVDSSILMISEHCLRNESGNHKQNVLLILRVIRILVKEFRYFRYCCIFMSCNPRRKLLEFLMDNFKNLGEESAESNSIRREFLERLYLGSVLG